MEVDEDSRSKETAVNQVMSVENAPYKNSTVEYRMNAMSRCGSDYDAQRYRELSSGPNCTVNQRWATT